MSREGQVCTDEPAQMSAGLSFGIYIVSGWRMLPRSCTDRVWAGCGQFQCRSFVLSNLLPEEASLSWVKSLKEVFYKILNESRRLAFPQRKVTVDNHQVAILSKHLHYSPERWLGEIWLQTEPAWVIWLMLYQNQCAGRSLLRKILVRLQIEHHLLHLLHLCIAWLCSDSETGKETTQMSFWPYFLPLPQFFCYVLPFPNLQILLGCPAFMRVSVKP